MPEERDIEWHNTSNTLNKWGLSLEATVNILSNF